jgi:hypothetical protein
MSALPKSDVAPWSRSEIALSDLMGKGAHVFDDPVDPAGCGALLEQVRAERRFDQTLFLAEAEVHADDPPERDPAEGPMQRLLRRFAFAERAPAMVEALWGLLGPDYAVVERTLVCELPPEAVPAWARRRGQADPAGLDAFVRPELRDMAYVCGADFHQDLGRGAGLDADVLTLHVYLQAAGESDAPIHLLEGSHRMGATTFPHHLARTGRASWRYRGGDLGDLFVTEKVLTGGAGLAVLWHACSLHGTAPPMERERIALRYRFARGTAANAGIDAVNGVIAGPLALAEPAAQGGWAAPGWSTRLRA